MGLLASGRGRGARPEGCSQCVPHKLHAQCLHLVVAVFATKAVGLDPLAVLVDELHERIHSLLRGDSALHAVVADVEVHLAHAAADVAEVRVRHLARAVHDAAHDGDAHPRQVPRALLDLRRGVLEVEEHAAAGGAADELRLRDAHARRLQQVEGGLAQLRAAHARGLPEQALAQAVHEEAAEVRRGAHDGRVLAHGLGVAEPQHHGRGLPDRRERGEEAACQEGNALQLLRAEEHWPRGLRAEEQQPRARAAQGRLHLLARLLAGEDQGTATEALGQLRLHLGGVVQQRDALRHVLAWAAQHADRHV
mmetsp:Transcript_37270/g.96263  ORF Transcript_37270/g.96263 Transcript_37270/m.96263 type:complete len:308 (-) Transcript_37270:487-1410(-)